ncbi:hypothetical protein NCER_100849 [Vairimorpha ceranae BRL01]|uniref:Ribonuclease P/MRP protein subunit POP5 n=2 Tax=Vairimorpha ceranae TaxID=40302 RepID=C4V8M1_VAIC1|nr:hypothetical protein AAJ76_2700017326 [Vairimorpha ceranae]EEQ82435.1 hypothetical protein NCER_100849 [Vairimorpha ceranae BRL01]KAF5140535.1 hypothetical protein G9O61_00g013400 [Vairimorpha ceranae]KKO75235.1 hypothetical protein AAJ76_2700017326 [Vairimorpha ceranae]
MTVRKYRYISFSYSLLEGKNVSLENSIISIIRDKVNENFGEHVLYRLQNLALLEYLHENNIFVIRVDRDICKFILFSLVSVGQINGMKVNFKILFVSGIYKKLLKRLRDSISKPENKNIC